MVFNFSAWYRGALVPPNVSNLLIELLVYYYVLIIKSVKFILTNCFTNLHAIRYAFLGENSFMRLPADCATTWGYCFFKCILQLQK